MSGDGERNLFREVPVEEPVKVLCVDDERNVLRALRRLFVDDADLMETGTF